MHLCGVHAAGRGPRLDRPPRLRRQPAARRHASTGAGSASTGCRATSRGPTRSTPWRTRPGSSAILGRQYHAVVGNPPYITVKDATLNGRYRNRWTTCHRQYSLGVPFTERFFDLALAADDGRPAGLRRDDHGQLVHEARVRQEADRGVLPDGRPDARHRHLGGLHPRPRHADGDPFGRNRRPVGDEVRAVLGIRGEPSTPDDPAQGLVWRSIVEHLDNGRSQNEFVSVTDVDASDVRQAPVEHRGWRGGGAEGALGELAVQTLGETVDDDRLLERYTAKTKSSCRSHRRSCTIRLIAELVRSVLVTVRQIRDWSIDERQGAILPYDRALRRPTELHNHCTCAFLWPCQTSSRSQRCISVATSA